MIQNEGLNGSTYVDGCYINKSQFEVRDNPECVKSYMTEFERLGL
jgi:hypothetical protein